MLRKALSREGVCKRRINLLSWAFIPSSFTWGVDRSFDDVKVLLIVWGKAFVRPRLRENCISHLREGFCFMIVMLGTLSWGRLQITKVLAFSPSWAHYVGINMNPSLHWLPRGFMSPINLAHFLWREGELSYREGVCNNWVLACILFQINPIFFECIDWVILKRIHVAFL